MKRPSGVRCNTYCQLARSRASASVPVETVAIYAAEWIYIHLHFSRTSSEIFYLTYVIDIDITKASHTPPNSSQLTKCAICLPRKN